MEQNPGLAQNLQLPQTVREEIQLHEKAAGQFGCEKEEKVTLATRVGVAAVASLILGFGNGLTGVIVLFAYTQKTCSAG